MGKLILLILLGWLAYLLLRAGKRSSNASPSADPSAAEAMAECAICRLHVPRSESLQASGKFYCCEEHRRLDRD